VTSNYQVRVTRNTADYDDSGVPRVTKTPARVEIAALQQFIDACVKAREEAFGVTSNSALSEADKAAWARFLGRFTEL
jgi:hypothetical protein